MLILFLSISLYTLSEITEENRINIVLKLISSTIIFQELSALFVSQLEAYFNQNPRPQTEYDPLDIKISLVNVCSSAS